MAIKYKWLARRLEEMIEKQLRRGDLKLPTEKEIGARYHVSRQTVRMALGLLEENGLISRRQGSGSYLTGRLPGPQGDQTAILISNSQEYIYPGLLADIQNVLSSHGFSSQVFSTRNQVSEERNILLELARHAPRGIIVEGCKSALPNPNLELYRALMKQGCKVVFLHNYYPGLSDCLYVKDDNCAGSAALVKHLCEMGHRAIGGIFKADDMQGQERYLGFLNAMWEFGLPLPERNICWYGEWDLRKLLEEKDGRFLADMLSYSLAGCSALICYNDIIAYFLVEELTRAGYRLPQDMALAAFDNTYLSNSDLLSVTTLSHKPHEMGTKAAQALIDQIKGLPVLPQEIPWKLNLKESTSAGV